jgi:hypothetical protein
MIYATFRYKGSMLMMMMMMMMLMIIIIIIIIICSILTLNNQHHINNNESNTSFNLILFITVHDNRITNYRQIIQFNSLFINVLT